MTNSNSNQLDELMGFDPNNLNIFNATDGAGSTENPNIYRTSPKKSISEDEHYRCKLRLLYNPFNRKRTIVHSVRYNLQDENGYFTVSSLLGENDPNSPYFTQFKKCPLFTAWKKLHFNEDPAKKEFGDKIFKKNEYDYILVQVMEDKNQPEMVGRILPWKLPKAVYEKLQAKMNPSKESGKIAVNVLDYLTGRILDVEVKPGPKDPKQPDRYYRETKYDLCEFDTEVTPIMNVDGTPMFTDEELEAIEKYDKALTKIAKMKSPEEQANSYEILKANKLYTQVTELMKRAYEYLKENAIDLLDEVGYKPWDEELTTRVNTWIATALKCQNPAGDGPKADASDVDEMFKPTRTAVSAPDPMDDADGFDAGEDKGDDDLPF